MKRSLRGLFAASLILGIAVFALACGGSSDNGDNGGTPKAGGSGSTTKADLRLLGSDPITLDPALVLDAGSATYVVEIFSGLVTIDKDLKVVPDLAEKWDVSPDGKTYTFTIRKNALFHDGKPVTADDFKYSMERAAKMPDSVVAEAFLGDIVGAKDVVRGRAPTISGIKVVDASTLAITIDEPKPYFLAKMTYTTSFVVDKNQVESNPRNWTRKPNGTGPYKLVEYRINERIVLEANERSHLGAPSIKRVLFNLAGGSSLTQYENGEIDVSGIGLNDIERVQGRNDPLSKEYVTTPRLDVDYIAFNTKTPPFDDPKVRQAFSQAVNRDQLVRVVLKNMWSAANSFMMPGLPGYNKDAKLPPFDPDAAKAALAESKYKNAAGLGKVTLTEAGGGATAAFDTQALIEMWKTNLGVDVQIAQEEVAAFYDDLDKGKLQMWSTGWIMDYPDPEDLLDVLFFGSSRKNESRYQNADFDALILKARMEPNVDVRLKLYQDAEQILIKDLPWMPLYFGRTHVVIKPYVKNFDPSPLVIPVLRYAKIEK